MLELGQNLAGPVAAEILARSMVPPVPADTCTLIALPLSLDGARPTIRLAPPRVGEHDDGTETSVWER